jgi:hypothetical protein
MKVASKDRTTHWLTIWLPIIEPSSELTSWDSIQWTAQWASSETFSDDGTTGRGYGRAVPLMGPMSILMESCMMQKRIEVAEMG